MALVTIFIDHLASNPLANYTLRRYSLLDAADIFFFLSGYATGLVYTQVFLERGFYSCAVKSLRRCGSLYFAHIVTAAVIFPMFFLFAIRGTRFQEDVSYTFMLHPYAVAFDVIRLAHVPRMLGSLPTYIVLMAFVPAVIVLLCHARVAVLAVSGCLYIAAQFFPNLELHSHPDGLLWGGFNVFSWQFVFVLGALAGSLKYRGVGERWLDSRWLLLSACAALALIAFVRLMAPHMLLPRTLGLEGFASHIPAQVPFTDKRTDGPLRLLYLFFLIVVGRMILNRFRPHGKAVFSPLVVLGQNSLAVFCVGVVLAELGTLLILAINPGKIWWISVNSIGLMLSYAAACIATTIGWHRKQTGWIYATPGGFCPNPLPLSDRPSRTT
jgi:hypothetical protein